MHQTPKDHAIRMQGLSINASFIVQAPAGSGKTELLTQRFLKLLTIVKNPEEVVAITFTRKAAAEMRTRIIESLYFATHDHAQLSPHQQVTFDLAVSVLQRDATLNWNLLQNPNRLRILTIDALCARLAKSAPLLSQFGSSPEVVDDPRSYYVKAAQTFLLSINQHNNWTDDLSNLLLHLDNNFLLAENLFAGMLGRRDQWLSYVLNYQDADARKVLENGLRNIVCDVIDATKNMFSVAQINELQDLVKFSEENLKDNEKHPCSESDILFSERDEIFWSRVAALLLTKAYEWRRTVNKNCGFPAKQQAINQEEAILFAHNKERMLNLIRNLEGKEALRLALQTVLLLPPSAYSDAQWDLVATLTKLLPILVAHLTLIFEENNLIDFIGVAQSAIQALGDFDNPTELALNLDYRVSHLLVDEFQDTSVTQAKLLQLLTAGWQNEDGRTLFLVGDPMQSIYRFREAEVGIFLHVRKFGLGHIKLIPLTLEVNFRSEQPIINWINNHFSPIFPERENIELGAISYSPSIAFKDSINDAHVTIVPFFDPEPDDEANSVINIINKQLAQNPQKSIAILVRSRNHLKQIIPALKQSKVPFRAIEIEQLFHSSLVQDLLALTKALFHLGDRVAWLAILHAPWCGLELADLYYIANYQPTTTIWYTMQNYDQIPLLSQAGKSRLSILIPIIEHALLERGRHSLRSLITMTWYRLGGPACLDELHVLETADTFFHFLEKFDNQSDIDFALLEQKLISAYVSNDDEGVNVHLMTMHKAKGLEFDVVILPGLERKPIVDENRLLLWLERQNSQGQTDLILAPIKSLEEEFDPIYRYIRNQSTLKNNFEVQRLLYVATTRAKQQLYLMGSVYLDNNEQDYKLPINGSFLAILWPGIKNYFDKNTTSNKLKVNLAATPHQLRRHALDWQLPDILPQKLVSLTMLTLNSFEWSNSYLQHVGTIIHQTLQQLSIKNNQFNMEQAAVLWQKKLRQFGLSSDDLDVSLSIIKTAIQNTLADERGRWILNHQHHEADSELPISVHTENDVYHYVIDRTFVDDNDTRWIIDFKVTQIDEDNPSVLLIKAQERYGSQLESYATAIRLYDNRPIKLGLYFPLFSGWCEWQFN